MFGPDVRSDLQVKQLVSFAELTFGGLSVLVNNASAPHGDAGIESWTEAIETDLLGAMYATAIEAMRRGHVGSIVSIASTSALWHGRTTLGGIPGYYVANLGMICMTVRLAPLAETDEIRVNCLAPAGLGRSTCPNTRTLSRPPTVLHAVCLRGSSPLIKSRMLSYGCLKSLAGRVLVWWSEDAPRLK